MQYYYPVQMVLRNGASAAIKSRKYSQAVTFLEEGRSVFWSQALHLRTPMGKLESENPELAKELKSISHLLEQDSQREASWSLSDPSGKRLTTEQEAVLNRNRHRKWLSVIDRIRSLDGFRDFLLPTPFEALQKAATHGPIVMLNASDSTCDALIITLSDVTHVALPRCTPENIRMLVKVTQIACGARQGSILQSQINDFSTTMRDLPKVHREDRQGRPVKMQVANDEELLQKVLAISWVSVAKPILRSMNLKVSQLLYLQRDSRVYVLCRKRTRLAAYGGVPLDHSLSFPFTRQVSITLKSQRVSLITSFHLLPRRLNHSSPINHSPLMSSS